MIPSNILSLLSIKNPTQTTTMEALLSLAFDNLSSYDGPKIKKGIKQVDSLLAQICLSQQKNSQKKDQLNDPGKDGPPNPPRRRLSDLNNDPAFHEFFKLQEGFEWNVTMRLVNTLDRLMAKGSDGQNDLLIMNALDLLQGLLVLHPPSKTLFAREQNMNVSEPLIFPPASRPHCANGGVAFHSFSSISSSQSTALLSSLRLSSPSSSLSSRRPRTHAPLRTSTACSQ